MLSVFLSLSVRVVFFNFEVNKRAEIHKLKKKLNFNPGLALTYSFEELYVPRGK